LHGAALRVPALFWCLPFLFPPSNADFRIVFFHFNIVNVPLLVHHGVFPKKDILSLYTILVKRTTAFP
jgi:hypothetical protein